MAVFVRDVNAGTLPPGWSSLAQLSELRILNAPQITGPLPTEWTANLKLEWLELSALGISGPLDAVGNISTITNLALESLPYATLQTPLELLVPNTSATAIVLRAVAGLGGHMLNTNIPFTYPNISRLALSELGLVGEIPATWASFGPQQLTGLYLSGNALNGTLPTWLASRIARGYTLDLGSNQFTGKQSYCCQPASAERHCTCCFC
jgi:hypothetical protein